ncbi:MAG: bifunctional ADP-dependent NAD(P)H-hydrate dehydratase/NAD(P)H-hydrate epimerase [Chromatiales bacterium 21-64-14]|nr:MAG: bifunctional ADP-dependent NAD(P)H-hydrate dehydratase/NAD(P)H-hydrate epimerase [Chromatiales bacterium 21-64-14]HQU14744.1 NAD(P)H-hydrate dehydratase [Gammaproteobacteria bacterium]
METFDPDRCLYRAAQVRELDRIAIQEHGIAGYTLMTRAGEAVFAVLRGRWPQARRLAVVCGAGNNGGDGYVVARCACQAGWDVQVLERADPARIQGDAATARRDYQSANGTLHRFEAQALGGVDLIVDAVFGTGLEREVQGEWRAAVEAINGAGVPVVAVDIPSGLHADTGAPLGVAVRAAATVTFIGRKAGLYTGAGPEYCGALHFDGLGIPADAYRQVAPCALRLDPAALARRLPRRGRAAHKGRFGQVLIVGGDQGMAGAACMAAMAAARVGAGLVSVATRPEHAVALGARYPELMVHGIEGRGQLAPLLRGATVVAIGPGLGRGPWGAELLAAVLESAVPLVVDADALNRLAEEPATRADWVLTPHPGEAARLLGTPTAQVQNDRYAAAQAITGRYGGVVVLKGAGTLIHGSGDDASRVAEVGNPGMASGGMGDMLTGVIAGLRAQGIGPADAAELGVFLHGTAGDAAARARGERGLMATDLLPELHRLANPDAFPWSA